MKCVVYSLSWVRKFILKTGCLYIVGFVEDPTENPLHCHGFKREKSKNVLFFCFSLPPLFFFFFSILGWRLLRRSIL